MLHWNSRDLITSVFDLQKKKQNHCKAKRNIHQTKWYQIQQFKYFWGFRKLLRSFREQSNELPLCMITSDKQISPPSLALKMQIGNFIVNKFSKQARWEKLSRESNTKVTNLANYSQTRHGEFCVTKSCITENYLRIVSSLEIVSGSVHHEE